MPEWIMELLGISIPIIAVSGWVAWLILRALHKHRERMEMIEQGMHPDRPELEAGNLDERRDLIDR